MILNGIGSIPLRSRSDIKRDEFVDAAKSLFFERGFGATTMSALAAQVGGSKTTLWAYFRSKEAVFAAVVDQMVDEFGRALAEPMDQTLTLEEGLRFFGTSMLTIVTRDDVVELHRIVIGEAGRFPELAQLLAKRGPRPGHAKLAAFLKAKINDGSLVPGDVEVLTRQFVCLCQFNLHQQCLMGARPDVSADAIRMDVDAAISAFLAAYGA